MNETQRTAIGEQVLAARGLRGWSQKDLAAAAGIAPNTVGAIERGDSVQPGKLGKVLDALDIKPTAEAQEAAGYPTDIELIRDAIGLWLLDVPEGERAGHVRALLRAITSNG